LGEDRADDEEGLTLFNPVISVPVPAAFASQVTQFRTVGLPGSDSSAPGDSGETSSLETDEIRPNAGDELGEGVGDNLSSQSADATEDLLIRNLQSSPDPDVRAEAAEGLRGYRSERALEALANAGLADQSLRVKDAALGSIAEWSLEDLVEFLRNHPDDIIRQAAAAGLGRMKDNRAVEPLIQAMATDESANVRAESASSLGRLDDARAVTALIDSLQQDNDALRGDDSADVREAAATALGQLTPPEALPQLLESRQGDSSTRVRSAARRALLRYSVNNLSEILLNDPSAEVRAVAAKLLGERKALAAIPELIIALNDPEQIVRETAREALEGFGALTPLENGASVLAMHGGGIGLVPGTTARRAENLPQPETALFVVEGAANTTFLRTSVGEVFDGADWYRQRSATEFYGELERISSSELAGAPFSHLEGFDKEALRMTPEETLELFPVGLLPVPLFLETISADGAFELVANTFISYEDRHLLETASSIPVYSVGELANAATIDDEALALPNTTERVRQLAHQITAGYDSPYRKAQAIQHYLTQNYEYGLKDSAEADVPEGQDLVDWFLFESRIGTCGTFSSAFAILARSVGLPARVVSGWLIIPTKDRQVVYADQAHQIAEILFEGYGWVPFEATPGDGPASRAESNFQDGLQEFVEDLSSDDPAVVRNAERAIEEQGGSVEILENGVVLVFLRDILEANHTQCHNSRMSFPRKKSATMTRMEAVTTACVVLRPTPRVPPRVPKP